MTRAGCLTASFAILVLSACGSRPVIEDRYYSLVLAAGDTPAASREGDATARWIVGPVRLPGYLGTRQMVMQVGPSRIDTAHHHFWAESLDDAIAKVLTQDIAAQTGAVDVERDSGRFTGDGDCRVRLEFDAFHPTSESRVVAAGRYWISYGDTSERRPFSIAGTLTADGYAHAVGVLRDTLQTLALQISDELHATPACAGAAGAVAAGDP